MYWKPLFILVTLVSLGLLRDTQAQSSNGLSGFYVGFEGGVISYNTQITVDGVDDPAGRGGAGYGVFLGYSHSYEKAIVGSELLINLASIPDPYTFDSAAVGFSELDLRRGASIGLDARVGYLFTEKMQLYGSIGYSANRQSVRIDGVPLDQFEGGADPDAFGAFQFGAGVEGAIRPQLGFRVSFRSLVGRNLKATDFGAIPIEASLTRFDVEPSQQQFFLGLIFRF